MDIDMNILRVLEREKEISLDILVEAIEQALLTAYQRTPGAHTDARVELEEVAEKVDPRLAEVEEAVDTLGGLAFVLAEQVPEVGTILDHESGWRIEVTDGNERHVTRLRLHPPIQPEDPTE